MKLILASAGFYTDEIVNKCVELVGKPKDAISLAVINEAYAVEHGDHSWVLDDLNRVKNNFTGSMELVNLLALDVETIKKRIELADVIFTVGGNTDYLMHVFDKSGFASILPDLLKTKVYVGSSAGSMVLGKRISTEAYARIYGEEMNFGVTKYLELVDIAIQPHFDSKYFPNNREETLFETNKNYSGTVYGLKDDSAIIVDGENTYMIGSAPLIIKQGIKVVA